MNLKKRLQKIFEVSNNNMMLSYDNYKVSYKKIDQTSDFILDCFIEIGIKENSIILLLNDKSWQFFACMIACLKGKITFCNLDPDIPKERITQIKEITNPALLLCIEDFQNNFKFLKDNLKEKITFAGLKSNIQTYIPYIMFTSGSTGKPKGVAVTEDGLLRFIDWGTSRFEISDQDTLTNINPIYFDNSIFDFFVAIFNGAKLLPITKKNLEDPFLMVKNLKLQKPNGWFL